jgi:DNA polymerase-1
MKRLLLVDGHSLAYRAFFALPVENFSNSKGQATNAIYGFGSMLVNLIQSEKPTHIAVAFDVSRKTFRSEIFPEYKATRSATPDEFRSQMSYLEELVTDLGIKRFALAGYEADDILATLSTQAVNDGFEVLISTGDRDSFQLVNDQITVLYPKRGVGELARMTPAAVFEKYGLTPEQYPDFAALRGDPSDNLPSVPGVGEKTATKWIVDHGSLDALISANESIPGKAGESFRAHIEAVKLNRHLTALRHDVELGTTISELEWLGPDFAKIDELLQSLEIKALKEKIHALAPLDGQTASVAQPNHSSQEISVIEISASALADLLNKRSGEIALFAEGDLSAGPFAVAINGESAYLCNEPVPSWLLTSKHPKIVHGAKSLLRNSDIANIVFDTELAAYLINPGGRNLDVGDLAERFLGISLGGSGDDLFSTLDAPAAAVIYQLHASLKTELESRELMHLMNELELPTTFALSELERCGVAIDREKLAQLRTFFAQEVATETAGAHKAAGHEFNVASPKQLQVVLFDELGLPKTKKIKTGYTTDAESLEALFAKTGHPLLNHLLRIRETSKLLTTVDGLESAIKGDGRIHTTFQQTVTATGRLSSTDPNLQNIPVRTEEGRRIRDCFVPQAPYTALLTADYSQIEMRIMAHLSKDAGLIAAFKSGEDLHSTVASQVFGVKASDVDPEMRRQIKAMSYGLAYGLSSYGLSQQLDLTPGQAQALMDQYFERFGGIQSYLKSVVVEARERGYTETILGRRRYLPDLTSDNRQRREVAERMALNAPIQGSAADIIKVAMLKVMARMSKEQLKSRALLQVHDELIFEVYPGEERALEELVREVMQSAVELSLPLSVNVGIGASWDLAAH